MKKISTYTAKRFLDRFYELNPMYRVNSPQVTKEWRKLHSKDKERIYKSITKDIKVNAYDYFKNQLNK